MNKFTNEQKMKKSWLLPATAATLILLNIGRAIGGLFFYYTSWYQRILYDKIHHYQFGLFLLPVGYLLLKTYPTTRSLLYGVAIALVLDELFFVMEWFGKDPYFHRTFSRWMSFDLISFLVFAAVYQRLTKSETSQISISRLKSRL